MELGDTDIQHLARSARLNAHNHVSDDARLFRRILVALDFSETSCAALTHAIQIAKVFSSEIHCFHVIEVPYGAGEAAFIAQNGM